MPFVIGGYRAEELFAARDNAFLFRGRHLVLDKPVLVKVLLTNDVCVDDVRAVGRLQHRHVAALLDFGRDEASGSYYVVTDVAPRETLADLLRRLPSIPSEMAIPLIEQIERGLTAAGGAGLATAGLTADDVFLVDDRGRTLVKIDLSPPRRATGRGEDLVATLTYAMVEMATERFVREPAPQPPPQAAVADPEPVVEPEPVIEPERTVVGPMPEPVATMTIAAEGLEEGHVGQQAGPYRLERLIEVDDLGWFYAAEDAMAGTRVGVKVLRGEVSSSEAAVELYVKVASVSSHLGGPHVPHYQGFGQLPGGELYAVMDVRPGETLAGRLRRQGALPLAEATILIRQVAEVLAQAHAAGLVHGAVTAERLLVAHDEDGWPLVQILDFGAACLLAPAEAPTGAADVQALGMLARRMITSRLSDPVVETLQRMCASDPAVRPSMAEVAEAAATWPIVPVAYPAVASRFETDDGHLGTPPRWPLIVAGGLGAAFLAAVAVFVLFRASPGKAAPSEPPPQAAVAVALPGPRVVTPVVESLPPAPARTVTAPVSEETTSEPIADKPPRSRKSRLAAVEATIPPEPPAAAPASSPQPGARRAPPGRIVDPFEDLQDPFEQLHEKKNDS